MFTFSHHPTAISVLDGIKDAYGYLQKSWRTWLPVVGVIAACALVTHALVGSLDISTLYHQDVSTDQVVWNADAWSKLSGAFPASTSTATISWLSVSTAIWALCPSKRFCALLRPWRISGS